MTADIDGLCVSDWYTGTDYCMTLVLVVVQLSYWGWYGSGTGGGTTLVLGITTEPAVMACLW